MKRLTLNEGISHLSKGMELIDTLPKSAQRDASELDLRIPLGAAWMALKGWTAPEVWTSFHPALGLAKSLSRHEALVPIYYGLWVRVLYQGRVADCLNWVNEMLASAEDTGDPDLLIMGHRAACSTHYYRGDLIQSRAHGDRVVALYDEEGHRHLADFTNVDPKTAVGVYASLTDWILGYPDRAVLVSDANDTQARRRGHPFDLGWALTVGGPLWDFRCEPAPLLVRVAEAEQLGRAHNLPFVSEVLAQVFKGLAWLRAGRLAEGIPHLRDAMERWNPHGGGFWMPYFRAVLAEGLALSGDLEGGLNLIEDSLSQITRPGWEERWPLAEVLRLKGWMLQQQGKLAAAEVNYLASLDVGSKQQAKSWQLRTSTSLANLWQDQGKRKEAYDLLAPIYGWFTEGLDTKDLQEATALLEELGK